MKTTLVHRAAAGAALFGALIATFPVIAASPPSAAGKAYAVATDQADATRAALTLLGHGGNAADAAVAAALALGVVNPADSGLGGGGFALVYTARDKKVTALDFRETAPEKGTLVGVPGEPAGLELLSRRFGKKALSEAAAPAVSLAHDGYFVSGSAAAAIAQSPGRVKDVSPFFLPNGVPVARSTHVRRPDLAVTIGRFGAQGSRFFYEGAFAQKLAATGTMTTADLASYVVKERAPLMRNYDGKAIYTMPAPSAGGLMLLEVLGIYGASPSSTLAQMGHGSSAYIHLIAESMRGAFADRARIAGDPEFEKGVDAAYAAALDPSALAARRTKITPSKTHAPNDLVFKDKGTSHLVVADAEGNIVTLTTTVNAAFGSGIVVDGIVLNDQLNDFGEGPNRLRPKARPVSSMAPTIVLENGEPILAAGGSGGPRIATGVTQAVLARLLFDYDPAVCVSAPRFHTEGGDLLLDREIIADVRDALRKRGEQIKDEPAAASAVQMIARRGRDWLAASDPRKGGLAAAR